MYFYDTGCKTMLILFMETLKEVPPSNTEKFQTYTGSVEMRNDLVAMLFAEALDTGSAAVKHIAEKWPGQRIGRSDT